MALNLRQCIEQALRDARMQDASAVRVQFEDGTTVQIHSDNDRILDREIDPLRRPIIKVAQSATAGGPVVVTVTDAPEQVIDEDVVDGPLDEEAKAAEVTTEVAGN